MVASGGIGKVRIGKVRFGKVQIRKQVKPPKTTPPPIPPHFALQSKKEKPGAAKGPKMYELKEDIKFAHNGNAVADMERKAKLRQVCVGFIVRLAMNSFAMGCSK